MERIADFGNRLRFRRIVAITRAAHESITCADRKNDLREIRRQRDYPINFRWNNDSPPEIVAYLASCSFIRRSSGSTGGQQREADNNRHPYELIATGTHRTPILNHLRFLCLFVANTFFQ